MICDPCQADFITLPIVAARSWTIVSAGLSFERTAHFNSLLAKPLQSNAITLY